MSGALVAFGLAHGATAATDQASKEKTYALTRELFDRFRKRHGSIGCPELLGVDIGTADGRDTALRKSLFTTRCPAFVRDAAELASQLL